VSGANNDQTYAKLVCSSFNTYLASAVSQAIQDPSVLSDATKLAQVGSPALKKFADDMAKVTPPPGLETYHASVVASIRQLVDRMNNGQVHSPQDLADMGRQIQPDAATQARLMAAAQSVTDCNSVPFISSGALAGPSRTPRSRSASPAASNP
jgi:hypothetical protein